MPQAVLIKRIQICLVALATIIIILCALMAWIRRTVPSFPPTFPNYFAKEANGLSEVCNGNANQLSILMWVDYSDAHISNDFLSTCPELKCNITFDRGMINQSAAIVFYDRTVDINDIPQQSRLPHQHFVFFLMESALYTSEEVFKRFEKNFYTLTMTYRRDSDIFSPFGFVRLRKIPMHTADDKWIAIAKAKPKSLVWMASFCNTVGNREAYVRQIQRYMNVDVYGNCGPMKCDKTSTAYTDADPCEEMLKKQYKFYIAFENSVCKDFVTEKIFNRFQAHLVPIVMKRSHSEAVLPPGSFIAIDDFENVQAFVAYIRRLEENVTEYIQYYKWKDKYETIPFPGGFHIGFCQLCARIRADNGIGAVFPTESASDIRKWFIGNSDCYLNYGEIMAHSRNAKNVTLSPWTVMIICDSQAAVSFMTGTPPNNRNLQLFSYITRPPIFRKQPKDDTLHLIVITGPPVVFKFMTLDPIAKKEFEYTVDDTVNTDAAGFRVYKVGLKVDSKKKQMIGGLNKQGFIFTCRSRTGRFKCCSTFAGRRVTSRCACKNATQLRDNNFPIFV